MSSKPPTGYIDIRVFAHATEDPQKVQTSVKNLFPQEQAEMLLFEKTNCAGHHGNQIILFTAKLTDKKGFPESIKKIAANLSSLDKEALAQDIELHLDRGNLYLRFDKQSAFLGSPKLSRNDPIHFRIHFKNKTKKEILEFSKQAGLLP